MKAATARRKGVAECWPETGVKTVMYPFDGQMDPVVRRHHHQLSCISRPMSPRGYRARIRGRRSRQYLHHQQQQQMLKETNGSKKSAKMAVQQGENADADAADTESDDYCLGLALSDRSELEPTPTLA